MLSERELIHRLTHRFSAPAHTHLGIGDDAAVLRSGWTVITCDTLSEEVHFSLDYATLGDVAYRALASNLSDIAAMGASAGPFVLSLGIPPQGMTEAQFESFAAGLESAIEDHRTLRGSSPELCGGDIVQTPGGYVITITALGRPPALGVLRRDAAQAGDAVCVFRPLGMAAAGLEALRRGWLDDFPDLVQAHLRPRAELALGESLGAWGHAGAVLDLSDGLSSDLRHVLERSGVGITLDVEAIPISESTHRLAQRLPGQDPILWAISGGEDFSLCVTCPQERVHALRALASEAERVLYVVGRVSEAPELRFVRHGQDYPISRSGYEHFEGST